MYTRSETLLPIEIVRPEDITPYLNIEAGIFSEPFYNNGIPSLPVTKTVIHNEEYRTVTFQQSHEFGEGFTAERNVYIYHNYAENRAPIKIDEGRVLTLPNGFKVLNLSHYRSYEAVRTFAGFSQKKIGMFLDIHKESVCRPYMRVVAQSENYSIRPNEFSLGNFPIYLGSYYDRDYIQVYVNRNGKVNVEDSQIEFTKDESGLVDLHEVIFYGDLQENRDATAAEISALQFAEYGSRHGKLAGWVDATIFKALADGFIPSDK